MTTLSEAEGRAVLRERFMHAGLRIVEDYPFDEEGVAFSMDGFDAEHRVGYEYLTTEAGDREDLTTDEIALLEKRIERGEIALLLVDEVAGLTAEELGFAADQFIKHLLAAGYLAGEPEGVTS